MQLQPYRWSTVPYALGFSVFTSRILATDLSLSHCHFRSHVKSSLHRRIPVLPFFLTHIGLPSPRLSVFTSLILATDLSVSLSLQTTREVVFAPQNSCLAISSQSPWIAISRTRPSSNSSCVRSSLYSLGADPTENTVFSCLRACLQLRHLAVDVLLRALVLRECVYRPVA
jgi:hypothetical protein